MMEENTNNESGLVSVTEKSELPIGVHLFLAVIFLVGAVVYTISPIDFIPDVLGPIGWVDDIMVWVVAVMVDLSIIPKRTVKKGKERLGRAEQNAVSYKHQGANMGEIKDRQQIEHFEENIKRPEIS